MTPCSDCRSAKDAPDARCQNGSAVSPSTSRSTSIRKMSASCWKTTALYRPDGDRCSSSGRSGFGSLRMRRLRLHDFSHASPSMIKITAAKMARWVKGVRPAEHPDQRRGPRRPDPAPRHRLAFEPCRIRVGPGLRHRTRMVGGIVSLRHCRSYAACPSDAPSAGSVCVRVSFRMIPSTVRRSRIERTPNRQAATKTAPRLTWTRTWVAARNAAASRTSIWPSPARPRALRAAC